MRKILIVDDQPEVGKLLKVVLQEENRQFLLAENGEQAIEIARRNHPDIILLDIMMPGGMDGYEVTRILKKDPQTCDSPIIVMTAKVQEQDRIKAFESGTDDFISKPFNLTELKEKVKKYLH